MNDIDRFKFSFRNALYGIRTAFRTQRNLRIHLFIGILVIILSICLKVSIVELAILLLTILIVLATEFFNTAIEFTVDLVSPEYNHVAKKAKDVSAAGVLIAAIFAIMIGIVIFIPKLITMLQRIL